MILPLKSLFFAFVLLVFLSSCDNNRVFDENSELVNKTWNSKQKLDFIVPIIDTTSPNNLLINIRTSNQYPYSNLYLYITTQFPDGKLSKDTLECILADDKGVWLGKGLGDIIENRIPFKRNVRFPLAGNYTFTIEQAMRIENLQEVLDAGLRIEKQLAN